MDKKEFIFPGAILGVVLIIAIALLVSHPSKPTLIPSTGLEATTTASTTAATPAAAHSGAPASRPHAGPTSYYPYGSVTLALNQAAGFKDGVAIRPVAVTEDSRCPMGVMCIQAGTVRVSLKADINGAESVHAIELGKSVTIGSDMVTLTSVSPVRQKDGAPAPSAYRFTFTVTHGGSAAVSSKPCYVGGCSSEVCSDAPGAVSTCIYREAYGCYKAATCERQQNGACGWTPSQELMMCLASHST